MVWRDQQPLSQGLPGAQGRGPLSSSMGTFLCISAPTPAPPHVQLPYSFPKRCPQTWVFQAPPVPPSCQKYVPPLCVCVFPCARGGEGVDLELGWIYLAPGVTRPAKVSGRALPAAPWLSI